MQKAESVAVTESTATKSAALDSGGRVDSKVLVDSGTSSVSINIESATESSAPINAESRQIVSSAKSLESTPAARFYPPVVVREESRFSHIMRTIRTWYKKSDRFFHLLVGMPSYDKYVEHMRTKHPDREIKSQAEFFKEALDARYNGGVNRCC